MKRTRNISKQLFIKELEETAPLLGVSITTTLKGEEGLKPKLTSK